MPIAGETPGNTYYSSQPMDAIIAAVSASGADVDPFKTTVDLGRFLSNFIGYLGNWWHELNIDYAEPWYCVTGGHIHVGRSTVVAEAEHAMEVTIRVVISHVDGLRNKHGDLDLDDAVDGNDGLLLMDVLNGPDVNTPPAGTQLIHFQRADIGRNDDVDMVDVMAIQRNVGA
jgi:hypothetical protein